MSASTRTLPYRLVNGRLALAMGLSKEVNVGHAKGPASFSVGPAIPRCRGCGLEARGCIREVAGSQVNGPNIDLRERAPIQRNAKAAYRVEGLPNARDGLLVARLR